MTQRDLPPPREGPPNPLPGLFSLMRKRKVSRFALIVLGLIITILLVYAILSM